jgi:carbon-monoxide dehydrogenase large subunit
MDYLLPTAETMPHVGVDSIETPSLTLGGFKGLGEGAAIPTAGAITNAVDDALSMYGIRYVDLPVTPEKVRACIASAFPPK